MNLELQLAFRFLFSKKKHRFLSVAAWVAVLGLAFGVSALLISLSIVTGFQKEYKKAILGFNSHLIIMKSDEMDHPEDFARDLAKYENLEKLAGWSPFIYREGMIISGSVVKGVVFKGVDYERYLQLSHMTLKKDQKDLNTEKLPDIVLGKTLSTDLHLKAPILRALFPEGGEEKIGTKNIKRFFVSGTFESGLYEYDSAFAFLDIQSAERFFKTNGKVSGIEIWLENPDQAEVWASALRKDFGYPYSVMTWRELNENIFKALSVEKMIFGILMGVLVSIAILNILGTLMMLLIEKRGEVAILRALGWSWAHLRKVFIFDGLLIGSAGIVLGLGFGAGLLKILEVWQPIHLAPEVYFIRNVPVSWNWSHLAEVVVFTLVLILLGCEFILRRMKKMSTTRFLLE